MVSYFFSNNDKKLTLSIGESLYPQHIINNLNQNTPLTCRKSVTCGKEYATPHKRANVSCSYFAWLINGKYLRVALWLNPRQERGLDQFTYNCLMNYQPQWVGYSGNQK